MRNSLNIIRKQTVHFQYNGNADGFALQKEVSDWCNLTLIPEIERQLEFIDSGENVVTIDHLEIDASINGNDWKQKIGNELIASLKQKLTDYRPRQQPQAEQVLGRKAKLDELILYFFEHGYLPWWGKALLDDDFKIVLQRWAVDEMSQGRVDYIVDQLRKKASANAIERILNHLSPQAFFQFLKNISKENMAIISDTESFLNEVLVPDFSVAYGSRIGRSVYGSFLKTIIEKRGNFDPEDWLKQLNQELKKSKGSAKFLKPASGEVSTEPNRVKKMWQKLLIQENSNISGKLVLPNEVAQMNNIDQNADQEKRIQINKLIDQLSNPEASQNEKKDLKAELQEGIFIDNAGAVIFAAFLPALFKHLNIEKGGEIVNPDLAAKTIQYAVSGNQHIAEYELVLPKILCGLNIESPVNTNTEITDREMEEVDEMLLSVVEHWSALQSTSVQGLRESFLMRAGKLSFENDEWLLQVEQKAFDMLLERLPWGISMIKLPWMKHLLKTEWF